MSKNARTRWLRFVAVAMFLPAIAGGCDSGEPQDSLGWQALQNLSSFEHEVLRDKNVTRAEIDKATQVYVECLGAHQITVEHSDPSVIGPGGISTKFGAADDAEADRKAEELDQCYAQVSAVQEVWRLQSQASEEERQALMAGFAGCVRDAGLTVAEGASFEENVRVAQDAVRAGRSSTATLPTVDDDKVATCLQNVATSLQTALPGLAEALEALEIE